MREIQNSKPVERHPVRFNLIDKDGHAVGTFGAAVEAMRSAGSQWQGETRDGVGLNIQPTR